MKKKMKKTLFHRAGAVGMAVLMLALCLCACEPAGRESSCEAAVKIVTTIFPAYDFAREVGKDFADVSMLLKPGTESHSYDPSPQDMIRIRSCDLFIYVGGESDEWVRDLLSSGQQPKRVIALMDCVETVKEETVEGMTPEEEEGEEEEYDEHVWTSPKNAEKIVEKITQTLLELAPEKKETIRKNSDALGKELEKIDASFQEVVEKAARKTLVFGDRFPFRYFADAYGLTYYAAFPGCSAETEPSASTIGFLIDKVRSEKIPVVFTIEFSSGKVADTICESTGAKKLEFHSCHNVSKEAFEQGVTYVQLMQKNVEHLKEALS